MYVPVMEVVEIDSEMAVVEKPGAVGADALTKLHLPLLLGAVGVTLGNALTSYSCIITSKIKMGTCLYLSHYAVE